jgi:hypothetical protein
VAGSDPVRYNGTSSRNLRLARLLRDERTSKIHTA